MQGDGDDIHAEFAKFRIPEEKTMINTYIAQILQIITINGVLFGKSIKMTLYDLISWRFLLYW